MGSCEYRISLFRSHLPVITKKIQLVPRDLNEPATNVLELAVVVKQWSNRVKSR